MLLLPHGCRCSELAVHPKNWKQVSASTKKGWYIHYRFYDPAFPNHKQVMIKGMNDYKDPVERREITTHIIAYEISQLKQGYNPITKKKTPPIYYEIDPSTPFVQALELGSAKIKCVRSTTRDLKSILRGVKEAVTQLGLDCIEISQVRRKHIKMILEKVELNSGKESYHRFNKYRTCLMMIFVELVEVEAIEFNPVREIRKRKGTLMLREILTLDERIRVTDQLKNKYPEFYRFTNIFFHSGARLTEILRVKGSDVDLIGQRWKCLVKKGRQNKWIWKTIKDVAMPFWIDVMKTCGSDQFVFSKFLRPGPDMISTEQITRRWREHVKKRLGISKDFYSLKHLHTDEISALMGIEAAASHDGHTTPVITLKHYAVGEGKRRHDKLKGVNNPL